MEEIRPRTLYQKFKNNILVDKNRALQKPRNKTAQIRYNRYQSDLSERFFIC